MMKEWTANEWTNYFTNPPTPGCSGKILVADVHRAQQTANWKKLVQNKSTLLINLPPGCKNRVQPLNVSISKPLKHTTREQFEKHLSENFPLYTKKETTCLRKKSVKQRKYHETKKLSRDLLLNVESRTT